MTSGRINRNVLGRTQLPSECSAWREHQLHGAHIDWL